LLDFLINESWQDCTDLLLICKAFYAVVKPVVDGFARDELEWQGANAKMYSYYLANEDCSLSATEAQSRFHVRSSDLKKVPKVDGGYNSLDVVQFGIRERFPSFDEFVLHRFFNPGTEKKKKKKAKKFNSGSYNERLAKGLSEKKSNYYGGWG
jgi:hypothetical protein